MRFLSRRLNPPHGPHSPRVHHRTLVDATTIQHVRDRGLDHVVSRERSLKPLLNLKNQIKSEPSKSLPISVINERRDPLGFRIRPIEFIRKYPCVFQECLPNGGTEPHPNIKLTPEVINLDSEEDLVYRSESYKPNVADRIVKLLMLCRIHKIPLRIFELLKWELGLPNDYLKTVVPEFPDYFRVVSGRYDSVLELVCWSDELAVSAIEKKAMESDCRYERGMPIAFPMQFSTGFEMDKPMKKWVNEWQRLPYFSPYENELHLSPSSDESDKWTAGVLHELLHLFVGKQAEKENVLCFGEHLGIRSRFKRVLLNHPGIFYLSSKMGTYTVVLKEMYKRGMLVESNPLMSVRNQYLHLMHVAKEDKESTPESGTEQQKAYTKVVYEDKGDIDVEEDDDSDNEIDGEEDESDEDDKQNVSITRGMVNGKTNLGARGSFRHSDKEYSSGKRWTKTEGRDPSGKRWIKTEDRDSSGKHWKKTEDRDPRGKHGTKTEGRYSSGKRWTKTEGRDSSGKRWTKAEGSDGPNAPGRTKTRDTHNTNRNSQAMPSSRRKERSFSEKKASIQ